MSKLNPIRAARAMAALVRDPDDLPQVFTIIEALEGGAPKRLLRSFADTDRGARLLRERPDIVPVLRDREALRRMPRNSLAHAYLAFVESEGIDADGILSASEQGRTKDRKRAVELDFVGRRMRDTHDLWHAVTGYRGDLVGESAVLAFTLAQTWNTGIALIVTTALIRGRQIPEYRALIVQGFRRGRRASFLPSQDWEALLPRPLDEVRQLLGVDAPPVYTPFRSEDFRRVNAAAA